MVFGEIVEPSTRALIDDEFEEYPEYQKPQLQWEGEFNVPSNLDTLIFIESNKITKLFGALTLNSREKMCSLKTGELQIYKSTNGRYVILYNPKELSTGEIIEAIAQWLRSAKQIYAITSESASSYQNTALSEKPETLIRSLSNANSCAFSYKKLESPNIVSGLGADVLSFCIHSGLKSTLYVVYMDNSPFDSINTNSIIQLMKSLGLPLKQSPSNLNAAPSNLYL